MLTTWKDPLSMSPQGQPSRSAMVSASAVVSGVVKLPWTGVRSTGSPTTMSVRLPGPGTYSMPAGTISTIVPAASKAHTNLAPAGNGGDGASTTLAPSSSATTRRAPTPD